MRPVVVDTSLWVDWIRGRQATAQERARGRVLYMPGIVALELLSGVRDPRTHRLIDGLVETFSRNQRLLVPGKSDLKMAGNLLADLGWPAGKKANDALIAVSARLIGAEVWTMDAGDFVPLGRRLQLPVVSRF